MSPNPLEEAQRRVDAVNAAGGNLRQAARDLGIAFSTLHDTLQTARKLYGIEPAPRLRTKGRSEYKDAAGKLINYWDKQKIVGEPEDFTDIPGGRITGTYTLYDAEGKVISQGVSKKAPLPGQVDIEAAVKGFLADAPKLKINIGPSKFDRDVIPWFQMGDAHIGMLAQAAETGANFDLKIAERELCAAFAILFDECPSRERCVINDLGDATHYENLAAKTEHSGNQLDFDVRFHKMIEVYVRCMRFVIDRALEKFQTVDVIINRGNHSETNDIWASVMLREVYGHTGRVNVLKNTNLFIPYRMGNTFVMIHHGHRTKPEKLRQVMCQDFRQDWGECEFRYIDVGHLHHKMTAKEDEGCTLEMWNTLAGRDRFHNDGGYRGSQSITRVDRSRTYGDVGRRLLPITEIRAAITRATGSSFDHPADRREVFTV
jgi:hypothetical protein